jgi:hypothetical protein
MTILTTLATDAGTELSSFLSTFAADEIGQLAVAAVNAAEGLIDDATGQAATGAQKLEAAKTQLLNAAEDAGKDLTSEGTSVANFLIETALQAVTAGVVAAAVL